MSPNPYESPRSQREPEPQPADARWLEHSPKYHSALLTAVVVQAVLALLSALILDGGVLASKYLVAVHIQWGITWIIFFLHRKNPSPLDLFIVRYGIIPTTAAVLFYEPLTTRLMGVGVWPVG